MIFEFLTIALLHFLAVVSPGPDFAMTMKNAICHTKQAGIYTALGIALGVLAHVTYCILGLAIIISKSLMLFNIVKYLGAAYLIYLGIKIYAAKIVTPHLELPTINKQLSNFNALKQGFLCNLLNPKATLFFLGIFTLVIKPTTPLYIQGLYGLEMFLITFAWFSFVSVVITHKKIKVQINKIQHYINKFMGGFLILFGIKLAFLRHS